ncbi:unnamed protein product [Phytophthora lilii]|uniref:Unnamed protein product n=1 Tax=Phytophthora lilii TaxID=2077276 RepID=A0A9W6XBE4_9STRA|nr:unnamed protein product [Phytophthora lilii]
MSTVNTLHPPSRYHLSDLLVTNVVQRTRQLNNFVHPETQRESYQPSNAASQEWSSDNPECEEPQENLQPSGAVELCLKTALTHGGQLSIAELQNLGWNIKLQHDSVASLAEDVQQLRKEIESLRQRRYRISIAALAK